MARSGQPVTGFPQLYFLSGDSLKLSLKRAISSDAVSGLLWVLGLFYDIKHLSTKL